MDQAENGSPENRELRRMALSQLRGNWGNPVLACVVYAVVAFFGGAVPYVGFLVSIAITGPMLLGFTHYFVKLKRGEAPRLEELFAGFGNYLSAIVLHILILVFTFLWLLLLIVPGFVASYRYAMAYFILNERPGIGAKGALDLSKRVMHGYKKRLFYLDMGFFGWLLLCIPTLGIGLFWLAPYYKLARVQFYDDFIRDRVLADPTSSATISGAEPSPDPTPG